MTSKQLITEIANRLKKENFKVLEVKEKKKIQVVNYHVYRNTEVYIQEKVQSLVDLTNHLTLEDQLNGKPSKIITWSFIYDHGDKELKTPIGFSFQVTEKFKAGIIL